MAKEGPMWLGQPEIRQIVTDKLIEGDNEKYRLDAFSIMSNHVHVVSKPKISERNLSPARINGRTRFVSLKILMPRSCKELRVSPLAKRTLSWAEQDRFGKVRVMITSYVTKRNLTGL